MVYDLILPDVRDRVARDTKIVRIDGSDSIVMRFSAYLEDRSVRLVEIRLANAPAKMTTVTVGSKRFSFLPGNARDSSDATLEGSLVRLIRERVEPAGTRTGAD